MKFGFIAKHREDMASAVDVRGARCLAGWLLCLGDTTAQPAKPRERSLVPRCGRASLAVTAPTGARRVWRTLLPKVMFGGLHIGLSD